MGKKVCLSTKAGHGDTAQNKKVGTDIVVLDYLVIKKSLIFCLLSDLTYCIIEYILLPVYKDSLKDKNTEAVF